MKLLAAKEEQFLTDAKGKRTGVVLDLQTYAHLREAEEELETANRELEKVLEKIGLA